jgi:hypothetical protein
MFLKKAYTLKISAVNFHRIREQTGSVAHRMRRAQRVILIAKRGDARS